MASRRQVRQAAVQFLYARSTLPDHQTGPDFWALVNDQAGVTFDRARVKVLAHLQQGREAAAAKLQRLLGEQAASLLAVEPDGKLTRAFKALAEAEIAWAEQCGHLVRLTKANTGGWRRDLEILLPKSDELRKTRADILPRLTALLPAAKAALLPIFDKLETYDARARMVRFPQNHPEQRDLDHLHRLDQEMTGLATEARELGENVEQCLPELDRAIEASSTNFDLKRLSKVDLAILRLATWEILKRPDLDAAVSITEAVDLARAFSGEEAAAFVNGVLDHIAKS